MMVRPLDPSGFGVAAPASLGTTERFLYELGQEARAHRFRVAPNPCVGAAVLADGQELGRGFHERWGGPHAEVQAFTRAERSGVPRDLWDTLLVTLEPCSSKGKTPPCTEAILATGIKQVIVGALDPDPRHRGRGLELLRDAGLDVELIPRVAELENVAPQFVSWTALERVRRPRPWLIAKWAQTRSGHMTPPANHGDGRWISGPESQAEVQGMRRRVDAVVTGIGTVQADDPRLTLREPGPLEPAPLRIVLDSDLRISPDARLVQPPGEGESGGEVHVLCQPGAAPARHRALAAAGVHVHPLRPSETGHVSLRTALEWMWRAGVRRALLEAGPTLLEAFFESSFIDQVTVYTGNVNGGRGPSVARWLRPDHLIQQDHREVGDDAILEAFTG